MLKKRKIRKLIKKIDYRKRQLEWIRKKRKALPENVEKKLTTSLEEIMDVEKTFKKKPDLEKLQKVSYELEHRFKMTFNKYKQNAVWELFDELWLVVIIALILKFFVIGSYRVPSGSMVDTIKIGDNLFVAMFVHGLTFPFASEQFVEFMDPDRGDIVTFTEPNPQKKALVKRVIGIPGDTIFISGTDLFVNGKKIEREFVEKVTYTSSKGKVIEGTEYIETNEEGDSYKILINENIPQDLRKEMESYCTYCNKSFTVPTRSYFVMGDNRDDSLDSRYWGFVPRENIQGKPLFVWFSIQFGDSIFDIVEFRPFRIGHIFE